MASIIKASINLNENIKANLDGCLEMNAPFQCVGQNCNMSVTSEITDHVGTRRRLLSVSRILKSTGSDTIYLEFHVMDDSYVFPFESIIMFVGGGLTIWCIMKFCKTQSKKEVGIKQADLGGKHVVINGINLEVNEELGEQGSTLLHSSLNGPSRGILKPIVNGPPATF